MDPTRKTLYRQDSLGGQGEQERRDRTRPRSYSFADLIEEEEELQTKAARTKTITVSSSTFCFHYFSSVRLASLEQTKPSTSLLLLLLLTSVVFGYGCIIQHTVPYSLTLFLYASLTHRISLIRNCLRVFGSSKGSKMRKNQRWNNFSLPQQRYVSTSSLHALLSGEPCWTFFLSYF